MFCCNVDHGLTARQINNRNIEKAKKAWLITNKYTLNYFFLVESDIVVEFLATAVGLDLHSYRGDVLEKLSVAI